jgi:deoxyribodipyrimidine photolyase-related protein
MSSQSSGLFHTRISALLNLQRLLPDRVIAETAKMDLPLPSKEGFIRQVLGWREFVHQVHVVTDGFRKLPGVEPFVDKRPGDGGYRRWRSKAWKQIQTKDDPRGGAFPSFLGCRTPLPPAYWGEKSGLFCLDRVVSNVWEEGYSHHITRLMILANIATLLDVSPRELTDWFWVAYTDAYDWVVEPNVLGMGTYALGDLMTTKPYVSGTPYIMKMSDYCDHCAFDPKKTCPISGLYWAFLARHEGALKENPRLKLSYGSLGKRSRAKKEEDQALFQTVQEILGAVDAISPNNIA